MRHARSIASATVDAFARTLSFALLILALLGYCGLPSDPPDDLFRPPWLQLARADPDAGAALVAPGQAKEYRAKDALDDDTPPPAKHAAMRPADVFLPLPSPAQTRHDGIGETRSPAMTHMGRRSRAPPPA